MVPDEGLRDQVVIVTGASRGIGQAIARVLAAHGARVVAASRSAGTPASKATLGPGVTPVHVDVRSPTSVADLFGWVDAAAGRVDALVVNAGIGRFEPITKLADDDWRAVIETNLTGAFLCIREAMRRMAAQKKGRIVAIGSIADRQPFAENAAYSASKYGLRGLIGVVNEEGKDDGVFATLVSPGAVATEIWQGRPGFDRNDMLEPDDVAHTVASVLLQPSRVRVDSVVMLPPRGVL